MTVVTVTLWGHKNSRIICFHDLNYRSVLRSSLESSHYQVLNDKRFPGKDLLLLSTVNDRTYKDSRTKRTTKNISCFLHRKEGSIKGGGNTKSL